MQSRLARIFNPKSNRTVMLAFDHGYFQGPTTGLERIDLSYRAAVWRNRRADVYPWGAAKPGAARYQQTGGAAGVGR
jgi:DhnA family fructose-bisphosphate aldolase class Ia